MADTDVMAGRLREILDRMTAAARLAGRDEGDVRLLAVSKTWPVKALREAWEAGVRDFGENYAQELAAKHGQMPAEVRWHFIGPLQGNKAKLIAGRAAYFHSLDNLALAARLSRRLEEEDLPSMTVFINVNVGGEDSKHGIPPREADLFSLVEATAMLPRIRLQGLMTLPPYEDDPGGSRRHFAALRHLRDRAQDATGVALPELSMGMSHDFEAAIAEGATWVRVGTALFGRREMV